MEFCYVCQMFQSIGFYVDVSCLACKVKKKINILSQSDRFLHFIPSQMNSSTRDLISQNIFILHV